MSLRIVFMGTPEFAVPSLDILIQNGYNVVGVVTATDKMGGRGGKQLIESAVKKYALEKGLKILQPEKLKSPEFIKKLQALNADLQIVVAFRMLPEIVWAMPPKGTFNLHGSLLPKYRGAAPINWAIINGETETGVTTFFLQHEIDTGDVILQTKLPIDENETAGEVHDRMMLLGAETVLKTVQMIEKDNIILQKQNDIEASHAPKLFHETCEINFNQPTQKVHNFIRGLSPYPAAWATLDGLEFKILRTTKEIILHDLEPGKFISDNKKMLKIATIDGFVHVHELQLQGRKRMDT
ncbi:MAG: methionyl-tRNA formyltransferase, partial [Saprospiraceae bacterium]|nr:methionyl-tRNA formyltransferase [Saprospiraceae bacterium]